MSTLVLVYVAVWIVCCLALLVRGERSAAAAKNKQRLLLTKAPHRGQNGGSK